MSFIHVVGHITTQLEQKVSQKGNPYVRFSLEERITAMPAQHYQVWAYGWEAERLLKWKLRPGSILEVNGPLYVEEFTEKDGYTPGIRLKIIYRDRGPVHWHRPDSKKTPTTPPVSPNCERIPLLREQIDGDREPLPE